MPRRISSGLTIATDAEMRSILESARDIAVLGIKPETRGGRAAHWIPSYLAEVGYRITPVPVYYPDVTTILGQPVVRRVQDITAGTDVVSIFRRPDQIHEHIGDIVEAAPRVAWFQSGLLEPVAARAFTANGIIVCHACIGCQRALIEPVTTPLAGQLQSSRQPLGG